MSRETKFRAWNKEKKIMCYANEDDRAELWDGVCCSDVEMVNTRLNSSFSDYEWMQYIGKEDINKKEIYEGDIVRNFLCIDDHREKLYEQGVVKFDKETLGFFVFDDEGNKLNIPYMGNIEVIGNVYENPDLLDD